LIEEALDAGYTVFDASTGELRGADHAKNMGKVEEV
jgi:hypothetical protein